MFNPSLIMTTETIRDIDDTFSVDEFLDSVDSPLRLDVDMVGPRIEVAARECHINPKLYLVKLQVEQSLITRKPKKPEVYGWAFGIGKTDSGERPQYYGFSKQLEWFGKAFNNYMSQDHPLSVVKKVGVPWNISDGTVICKDLATAALYRYTPWIGNKDFKGHKSPFGNYLLWLVAKRWFPEIVVL